MNYLSEKYHFASLPTLGYLQLLERIFTHIIRKVIPKYDLVGGTNSAWEGLPQLS